MNKILNILFLVILMLLVACTNDKSADSKIQSASDHTVKTLRVGFPPDENPDAIIRKNKPLLDYIKSRTSVDSIELIVPKTYTAAVEMMSQGKLDMVYFGGLTYVLAKKDVDITPLVRGKVGGTAENYTYIVTRTDSGINSIEQLKGKRFAFGDVASTSGHLIPHKSLLSAGIDPNKDFSDLKYTGAHDKTALAVFNKEVDAGAMNARKFPAMVSQGIFTEKEMKILWKSPPFADYPWAAVSSLGEEMLMKIQTAFVELDDPVMLKLLGVEGYEKTTDQDFENLRKAAQKLGFMDE